jgi:hypothetical protein
MEQAHIVKCCECGQIRVGTRWQQERMQADRLVIYSHTYCPPCLQRVLQEFDEYGQVSPSEMRKAG